MKRKDKDIIIEKLTHEIKSANHFYLTDLSDLNAADTSALRRLCFSKNIKLLVVKNTLLQKALERTQNSDFAELTSVLNGHTSVMFSDQANVPAKLIKEFRKKHKKPLLKAAYAEQSIYIGDDQINALDQIKSKNELIADVIALLQSPIRNVMSGLQSGGHKISGILETLSKREN